LNDLEDRTLKFALSIIKLYGVLPRSVPAQVIGRQFVRSGTSVGANYREARRSRNNSEFTSKLAIALQELSETEYWLLLLKESTIISINQIAEILKETEELMAIFASAKKTATKSN